MIIDRYPAKPHKTTRADWWGDIAAAIGTVLMITVVGFYALTGEQPLPDSVQSTAHQDFVRDLCPHLPQGEEQTCRAWLAKGGSHE